jgi:hypothetical protein
MGGGSRARGRPGSYHYPSTPGFPTLDDRRAEDEIIIATGTLLRGADRPSTKLTLLIS